VTIDGGSPIILGNVIDSINQGIYHFTTSSPLISNNTILELGIFSYSGNVPFTNNYLAHNSKIGIQVDASYSILEGNMVIQGNTITNCSDGMDIELTYAGSMLIQGNLIGNCSKTALNITAGIASATVTNNTFGNSSIAVGIGQYLVSEPFSIANNNFEFNNWNIYLTNSQT
jgi:parallel beta-helix repeat protein